MDISDPLRSFLAKFAVSSDKRAAGGYELTHTSLSGGSYYIPRSDSDAFIDLYVACVLQGRVDLHIVERHRTVGPVLIDLDFKQSAPDRLYGPGHVEAFCGALSRLLSRFFVSAESNLTIYVLEKEAPRPAKHGSSFKDGIHVVVPGAVARPEVMYSLRDALVPVVADVFGSLGFINTPDDILDDSVIERNGWLMYGSRKPLERSAWTLTCVFERSGDGDGGVAKSSAPFPDAASLVRLFSIRNKPVESAVTPFASSEIERRVKIAEEVARRNEAAAAERRQAPPSSSQDVRIISDLVGLLSPARADKYNDWIRVGLCLRGIDEDLCFVWDEFSQRAPEKYVEGHCYKVWARMTRPTTRAPLSIGSLIKWAKDDSGNSLAFKDVMARKDQLAASVVVNGEADDEKRMALCEALRARFPVELGALESTTFFISNADDAGTRTFADPASGLAGTVSPEFIVYLTTRGHPPRFLGLLFEDVMVKGPLSNLHKQIPPGADFVLNRPEPDRATLRSVTPNLDALVTQYHIGKPHTYIGVELPGKPHASLAKKLHIDLFSNRVRSAVTEHAASTPLAWFVNTGVVNNGVIVIGSAQDRIRSDYDFLPIIKAGSFHKRVVAVSEQQYYVLDAATKVWLDSTLINAAGTLRAMAAAGELQLDEDEANYIKKFHGANQIIKSVFNELQDREFLSKLDSLTPKGCVPMKNGMFDAASDKFRPFVAEDMVSRTLGYPFAEVASVTAEATHAIADFYEKILPCAEEREYFLRMMGAALFGSGRSKYFLILTDERDGSNGKTTLMRAVESVFDTLSASTQRSFLNVSTFNDPTQHAANLLAYKGKRLAFFDEPDKDAKLDIRRLKDLSSGASRQSGRACGGKTVEDFMWEALIVLACNEANFPVMDASDQPFLTRMKPLRMRSLFVEPARLAEYEDEPFVYPRMDEGFLDILKAPDCRAAHLHLLAAAYRRYVTAGGLGDEPSSIQEMLRVVVESADPRIPDMLDFLDENIDFAPVRKAEDKGRKCYAWLTEKDIVNAFWEANKARLKANKEKKTDYQLLVRRCMELRGRKHGRLQPTNWETGKGMSVLGYDRVAFISSERF